MNSFVDISDYFVSGLLARFSYDQDKYLCFNSCNPNKNCYIVTIKNNLCRNYDMTACQNLVKSNNSVLHLKNRDPFYNDTDACSIYFQSLNDKLYIQLS